MVERPRARVDAEKNHPNHFENFRSQNPTSGNYFGPERCGCRAGMDILYAERLVISRLDFPKALGGRTTPRLSFSARILMAKKKKTKSMGKATGLVFSGWRTSM